MTRELYLRVELGRPASEAKDLRLVSVSDTVKEGFFMEMTTGAVRWGIEG
jgi:hypothetical protein